MTRSPSPRLICLARLAGLVLALALAPACAPERASGGGASAAPGPAAQAAGPPLWRTGDEDTTVFLFGTVHVLRPGTDWQTPALLDALAAADALYVETDVSAPGARELIRRVYRTRGVLPAGERLSARLGDDGAALVGEAAAATGLPPGALERLTPWRAALQLASASVAAEGYAPGHGVETALERLARDRGLARRYLESVAEQLALFADMPAADQEAFLLATARQVRDDPGGLDRMVAAWRAGDTERIARTLADPATFGSTAVHHRLLVARNRVWSNRLVSLIEEEPGVFLVAVGVGHLVGETGLPAQLEAAGHRVVRVPSAGEAP